MEIGKVLKETSKSEFRELDEICRSRCLATIASNKFGEVLNGRFLSRKCRKAELVCCDWELKSGEKKKVDRGW